jgi:hypothetical protein
MFARLLCWMFGHRYSTISRWENERSQWGYRECERCGHCESWQHDGGRGF